MSSRIAAVFGVAGALGRAQSASEKAEFFEGRIRPMLANHCYSCPRLSGGWRIVGKCSMPSTERTSLSPHPLWQHTRPSDTDVNFLTGVQNARARKTVPG